MRLIRFGPGAGPVAESEPDLADLTGRPARGAVTWLDVTGAQDTDTVRGVGAAYGLHPLALEDVAHVGQRAKLEPYGDHLFVVAHMVSRQGSDLVSEQLSMFIGDGFVVTFQERAGDCLEPLRRRIREGLGRVRSQGADYLAYAILDTILDHYVPVTDAIGQALEDVEDEILVTHGASTTIGLLGLKHDLRTLRRLGHGLRDVFAELRRHGAPVIQPDTDVYLRDGQDHAQRLVDSVESWRDFSTTLMDVQMAMSGQQLNAVMKVLTIISTIFIPLGFIAGLYGMNFDPGASSWNMPELSAPYGYPVLLFVMACVAAGQLLYFRRKGWLGSRAPNAKTGGSTSKSG